MKRFVLLTAMALMTLPAIAQERRTASDQDVLTQPTQPAPDIDKGQNIILQFGQTSQVYFKHPFKSIRLSDPLVVTAMPVTDHIVAFTGLSPGESLVTLESVDGRLAAIQGNVLVVRSVHEVKVYTPKPIEKTAAENKGSGVMIVNQNSSQLNTREADEADYKSILCNGISCQSVPKPSK